MRLKEYNADYCPTRAQSAASTVALIHVRCQLFTFILLSYKNDAPRAIYKGQRKDEMKLLNF